MADKIVGTSEKKIITIVINSKFDFTNEIDPKINPENVIIVIQLIPPTKL